ncbi:MAG: ubiquitin-like small modifier protein 1 [Halobacteriales archaeon]
MEWRLFADIAEAAGSRRVTVELDGERTVAAALDALVASEPELEALVLDDGELASHLTVLRNGRNVETEGDGLDTAVAPDDELALFPPVSGG